MLKTINFFKTAGAPSGFTLSSAVHSTWQHTIYQHPPLAKLNIPASSSQAKRQQTNSFNGSATRLKWMLFAFKDKTPNFAYLCWSYISWTDFWPFPWHKKSNVQYSRILLPENGHLGRCPKRLDRKFSNIFFGDPTKNVSFDFQGLWLLCLASGKSQVGPAT